VVGMTVYLVASLKNLNMVFSSSTLSTLTAVRASVIFFRQTSSSGSALPSTFKLLPYC